MLCRSHRPPPHLHLLPCCLARTGFLTSTRPPLFLLASSAGGLRAPPPPRCTACVQTTPRCPSMTRARRSGPWAGRKWACGGEHAAWCCCNLVVAIGCAYRPRAWALGWAFGGDHGRCLAAACLACGRRTHRCPGAPSCARPLLRLCCCLFLRRLSTALAFISRRAAKRRMSETELSGACPGWRPKQPCLRSQQGCAQACSARQQHSCSRVAVPWRPATAAVASFLAHPTQPPFTSFVPCVFPLQPRCLRVRSGTAALRAATATATRRLPTAPARCATSLESASHWRVQTQSAWRAAACIAVKLGCFSC